jgi:hypothetical protein
MMNGKGASKRYIPAGEQGYTKAGMEKAGGNWKTRL